MNKREYLYSFGTRRHIAYPPGEVRMVPEGRVIAHRVSFCQGWFDTEAYLRRRLSWWNPPDRIEQLVEAKKALPVCKLCETRATKMGVIE
jgi:hypothetical protein